MSEQQHYHAMHQEGREGTTVLPAVAAGVSSDAAAAAAAAAAALASGANHGGQEGHHGQSDQVVRSPLPMVVQPLTHSLSHGEVAPDGVPPAPDRIPPVPVSSSEGIGKGALHADAATSH